MDDNEALYTIIHARDILYTISKGEQNGAYREIIRLIDAYIDMNCIHDYIEDMIDVDIERSQLIRYCKHCSHTA